jgi:hypothetical protein
LSKTRVALLAAVDGLSPEDWERRAYADGGEWTVKQLLTHVASAEPGQLATGQRMLAGEAKLGEGFSLHFWNQRQVEKRKDRLPADLLDDLAASRQQLLAWIDGLAESDFEKSGQHARGDFITVEQLCYRVGEHEAEHAAQIARAVGRSPS